LLVAAVEWPRRNSVYIADLLLDRIMPYAPHHSTGRIEGSAEGPVAIDVSRPENKLVMESIIRRIRMNEDVPSGTDALGDASEEPK
jgi:hypothetical protein